jgi:copper chaperone NosL
MMLLPRAFACSYRTLGTALAIVVLTACGRTPPPIAYGEQGCDYCRMEIVDERYGGQLVTTTGKVYSFDSVECLAEFAATVDGSTVRMIRVADFSAPGTMVRAEDARFYRDERRSGPMGGGWLAISGTTDSSWVALNVDGDALRWDDVRRLAEARSLHGGAPEARHAP